MKLIKYTIALSAVSGLANAQGLFDVNPNLAESESSPLEYNAGVTLGYDENVNPTSGLAEESSAYAKAYVGANVVTRGPRSSWDVNALVSQTRYFDTNSNQNTSNARLAFNLSHHINDRTRYVNNSFVNYGIDLGNFYGPLTSRQLNEYLYISTDNAIGYRWTDRLATYTGVNYSTIIYDDASNGDVTTIGVYNNFRYTLNNRAVLTASYRYNNTSYDTGGNDRNTQTASLGLDYKVSDTDSIVLDFGAQFSRSTSPYAQIHYAKVVSQQTRLKAFARYGLEDADTVFGAGRYENKTSLRIGFAVDHTLSPNVVLTAGGNYVQSDFEDHTAALADGDWDLFNAYLGATYRVNEAVSFKTSINYTDSDSSATITNRTYDRLRYELGLNYSF